MVSSMCDTSAFNDFIESKESQKDALGNQPLPVFSYIGLGLTLLFACRWLIAG